MLFLAGWAIGIAPAAGAERPRSILVLEQSDVRGPFYAEIFSALRSTLNTTARSPVTLYVENLDLNRFDGAEYEASLQRHFAVKYRGKPIGAVVVVGTAALQFALRRRSALWPDAPIVFSFVDQAALRGMKLPDDVTGRVTRLDLSDLVAASRILVPDLEHVAVVGDRFDTQWVFRHFSAELSGFAGTEEVIDLSGLPMDVLLKRVGSLPPRTAIVYTAVYSDGHGTYSPPADALSRIAAAANRPIVAPFESYVGRGAVGGIVIRPAALGREAAALALGVLDGGNPAEFAVAPSAAPTPIFDGRELRRWGIDEALLPVDSEIRFLEPSILEQHPREIAAVVLVIVLQSTLISALLLEHRRRRRAEREARARLNELAHVNRYAIAGELSASIAHELSQPLGAMLANTEAAQMMLASEAPDIGEVKEALGDIKRDNLRANEVIASLRRLLKKADTTMQDVDLDQLVEEVFRFLAVQAAEDRVELVHQRSPVPVPVHGDAIQLQQVVLNLVINAIEAARTRPEGYRSVTGRTDWANHRAEVTIADTGPGIPASDLHRVFDPFYSTKANGMGMGLSIARTIMERHDGSIAAANLPGGGGVFRLDMPLARPDPE